MGATCLSVETTLPFPFLYLNASSHIATVPIKKKKNPSQTSNITPSVNYHWKSHRRGRAAIPLQSKGRRGMLRPHTPPLHHPPFNTQHTASVFTQSLQKIFN